MDVIHRVAAANGFDARGAEQLGEAKPLGSDYGEVTVTETFNCAIEQFVNFMAALAQRAAYRRDQRHSYHRRTG